MATTVSNAQEQIAELEEAAARLESAAPQEILRWAVEKYRPNLCLACSFGMQSVACIDMLANMNLLDDVEVFYLDTGVLFAETHQTRLRIQEKYGFRAIKVSADLDWDQQLAQFGGHLYERGKEGVDQCCELRKTIPQRNYLIGKSAWITGMRRSHAKTRASLPVVQWDAVNQMAKINPMAAMDDATVWGYIKMNDVPYNPLYDQGYPSIGCNTSVCTRKVKPGEDPRSGRWAGLGKVECGIHLDGNQIKSLDASQL